MTLPNGNTVSTLANGEIWATIHPDGVPIAIRLTPDMPARGQFQTLIVQNLPESNIVNAPQSAETVVWGNCQSKTYEYMGSVFYQGKMRSGPPTGDDPTPPEGVTRRVEPDSPMDHIFHVICQP